MDNQMESKMENQPEQMNGMTELNPEDMVTASGGGPRIREMLIQIKKAARSNRGVWDIYEEIDARNGGDSTDNEILEELVWGVYGIPMRYDYENDTIIFENSSLEQVCRIFRNAPPRI